MGEKLKLIDRFLGAMVGLAVGDALGTTVEFKRRGTFPRLTDMVGGGSFRLRPGEWTDDTSMALCLADSLVRRRTFDPADQMQRYVRWKNEGYMSSNGESFDIGFTTRSALEAFEQSGDPLAGSTDPDTAGNGSLMRLAPVPLFLAEEPARAIRLAGESSLTTHGERRAVDGCRYFAGLIVGCLEGRSKKEILQPHFTPVAELWERDPLAPEIDAVAGGSFKHRTSEDIRSTGYVVHTLEAALWAFYNNDSFDDGVLAAVNLGDDADTVGAVYGQIAGAYYGVDAIRQSWRDRIAKKDTILELATRLYECRGARRDSDAGS